MISWQFLRTPVLALMSSIFWGKDQFIDPVMSLPYWGGQTWWSAGSDGRPPPHPSPLIPPQCNPHWTWAMQHNCFQGNAKNYTLQWARFKVFWKKFPTSVFIQCHQHQFSLFLHCGSLSCWASHCILSAALYWYCIALYFPSLHCIGNPGNKGGKLHQSSPDTHPVCTQGGTPLNA